MLIQWREDDWERFRDLKKTDGLAAAKATVEREVLLRSIDATKMSEDLRLILKELFYKTHGA
jgi:hypothetical protein